MTPINEQEAYLLLWQALHELGWETDLVHATYMVFAQRKMRNRFVKAVMKAEIT